MLYSLHCRPVGEWPSAVVCSMVGLLSLWHIPHFQSQFYRSYKPDFHHGTTISISGFWGRDFFFLDWLFILNYFCVCLPFCTLLIPVYRKVIAKQQEFFSVSRYCIKKKYWLSLEIYQTKLLSNYMYFFFFYFSMHYQMYKEHAWLLPVMRFLWSLRHLCFQSKIWSEMSRDT